MDIVYIASLLAVCDKKRLLDITSLCITFVSQITVTVKKDTSEAQKLKELVHRKAPSIIREQLEEYLRCLKEGMNVELLTFRGSTIVTD